MCPLLHVLQAVSAEFRACCRAPWAAFCSEDGDFAFSRSEPRTGSPATFKLPELSIMRKTLTAGGVLLDLPSNSLDNQGDSESAPLGYSGARHTGALVV